MKGVSPEIWKEIQLVFIDEISMCGSEDLELLDARLKTLKDNADAPFGGLGLCLIGDFSQSYALRCHTRLSIRALTDHPIILPFSQRPTSACQEEVPLLHWERRE